MTAEIIAEGRAALRRGDANSARALLEHADPTPVVLEVLASASFVLLEYDRSLQEMQAAYAGYRANRDGAGAARVARMLDGMHGSTSGDWAVASGWIARAKTLLGDLPDSNERGWVALTEGMFEGNRARKDANFQLAVEIGRPSGDADLSFAALAYLGASLVHSDRLEEGMLLLDEACAAVAGGEVDSFSARRRCRLARVPVACWFEDWRLILGLSWVEWNGPANDLKVASSVAATYDDLGAVDAACHGTDDHLDRGA